MKRSIVKLSNVQNVNDIIPAWVVKQLFDHETKAENFPIKME